jgi:hypothetical protein
VTSSAVRGVLARAHMSALRCDFGKGVYKPLHAPSLPFRPPHKLFLDSNARIPTFSLMSLDKTQGHPVHVLFRNSR